MSGFFTFKTVVLIGKPGAGKSTFVEKANGIGGLSSSSSVSCTRAALAVRTACQTLQMIDTPGFMDLEQSVHICHALSQYPVSLILLVVKAEPRIDEVMSQVINHTEQFLDFESHLCPLITHMDTVKWNKADLEQPLFHTMGNDRCILVGKDTPAAAIIEDVLAHCKQPLNIQITLDNFMKHFSLNKEDFKILKSINDEVAKFKHALVVFNKYYRVSSEEERRDLVFEFQACMKEEVIQAQKRVHEKNNFGTYPSAIQRGHLADLKNKSEATFDDVHKLALAYQAKAVVSGLRKCPFCGFIWANDEGCDGPTICGTNMRESDFRCSMATFDFACHGGEFTIRKHGTTRENGMDCNRSRLLPSQSSSIVGCGMTINWTDMVPVQDAPEFLVHGAPESVVARRANAGSQTPLRAKLRNMFRTVKMKSMSAPPISDANLRQPKRNFAAADGDIEGLQSKLSKVEINGECRTQSPHTTHLTNVDCTSKEITTTIPRTPEQNQEQESTIDLIKDAGESGLKEEKPQDEVAGKGRFV